MQIYGLEGNGSEPGQALIRIRENATGQSPGGVVILGSMGPASDGLVVESVRGLRALLTGNGTTTGNFVRVGPGALNAKPFHLEVDHHHDGLTAFPLDIDIDAGERQYMRGFWPDPSDNVGRQRLSGLVEVIDTSNEPALLPVPRSTVVAADATKTSDSDTTATSTQPIELTLAPGTYEVDSKLFYNSTDVADFASRILALGTVSNVNLHGFGSSFSDADGTATAMQRASGSNVVLPVGGRSGGEDAVCEWSGRITVDTTTTLTIRWAQRVSDASTTTLRAGSYLKATPI